MNQINPNYKKETKNTRHINVKSYNATGYVRPEDRETTPKHVGYIKIPAGTKKNTSMAESLREEKRVNSKRGRNPVTIIAFGKGGLDHMFNKKVVTPFDTKQLPVHEGYKRKIGNETVIVDKQDLTKVFPVITEKLVRKNSSTSILVKTRNESGKRTETTLARFILGATSGKVKFINGNNRDFRRSNLELV